MADAAAGARAPGWGHGAGNEKATGIRVVITDPFKLFYVLEVDGTAQEGAFQGGAATGEAAAIRSVGITQCDIQGSLDPVIFERLSLSIYPRS